jgi:outer membrane cobalamin receptor
MKIASIKFICLIVIFINSLLGQEYGTISGNIKCMETDLPLVAVNVYLKNTFIGTATDENGNYLMENIPPGKYELVVDIIGYMKSDRNIIGIHSGEIINRDFNLHPQVLSYMDDVTITATRGHSLITEVPSSINIIDQQELELKNPQNLAEAIQYIPGVNIKDYGGLGNTKSISLRGSSDSQVLVLLDGQRLNSPQSGSVDLGQISLEGVEKIEIVRGGNSALYGSDAIGGVINIISKKHDLKDDSLTGSLKVGLASFNTYSAEPSINFRLGDVQVSTSYKYLSSVGDFPFTDNYGNQATRLNSDIISNDIYLSMSRLFGDPHYQRNLSLTYKYYNSEQGSPGPIEPYYYDARMWNRNNKISTVYTGKIFNLFHNLRLQSYYYDTWYKYKNDETAGQILSKYKTKTFGNEVQFNSVLGPQISLTYGAGLRFDENKNTISRDTNNQSAYYLFIVNESVFCFSSQLKTISLVPSLRYDTDNKNQNNTISPKLGTILNFGELWKSSIKFNIGKSYRAPTFNDLYWPEDAWTIGNPNLEPEYGTDWDIGVRLQYPIINGIYFEASYFESNMTNLIIWQQIDKWMPLNVDKNRNRGIESSIRFAPLENIINITANYMYLDARNLSDSPTSYNKILVYRAKHTLNTSITLKIDSFRLNYQFTYVSRRFSDASNIWDNSIDPYSSSSITTDYETVVFKNKLRFSLQIINVFDNEYRVLRNMPVPGREYRFSMKVNI